MAGISFTSAPTDFNITPTIRPPTQGELEEARIKRLMDLARLSQMQREPGFQQQQLDLQRQKAAMESLGFGETSRHNVATETQADVSLKEQIKQNAVDNMLKQMGFDVTQRGQDVQMRGQDIDVQQTNARETGATKRTEMSTQGQTTDQLIRMFSEYGGDKNVLAQVLAKRGAPELLQVLGIQNKTGTGDPVADATLEFMKNKGTKKTSSTGQYTIPGGKSGIHPAIGLLAPYLYALEGLGKR